MTQSRTINATAIAGTSKMNEAPKSAKPEKVSRQVTATVKAPSTHPPFAKMVIAAITELKERNGSSFQAIKKFISNNYQLDIGRSHLHIRTYLKKAVANGDLIQSKGKGANGSFKMGKENKPKKVTKSKAPKAVIAESTKPIAAKPKKVKPSKVVEPVASKPKKEPLKVTKVAKMVAKPIEKPSVKVPPKKAIAAKNTKK